MDRIARQRAGRERHALWGWGPSYGKTLVALCRCGWRSRPQSRAHYAVALLEQHVADERTLEAS